MSENYFAPMVGGERVFTIEAPKIKFGRGALYEVGAEAKALGLRKIAIFTDPKIALLPIIEKVVYACQTEKIDVAIYDQCVVEPTDYSFLEAAKFLTDGHFDGVISVGGGSVIDTAKVANLLTTYPNDLMAYVNAPVGQAQPVPGPLMPHIACPTTFGTASECTGIAICDFVDLQVKSGIAHAYLRPVLGVIDPDNLKTLPAPVLAANGFDVFSHAIESITAKPFSQRLAQKNPMKRPLSQGANPYSDLSCLEAIHLIGQHLVSGVTNPQEENFDGLALAGMLAGIGFGNAGCHLPHAMSYAVAGLSHIYQADGWPADHPMVPHGISVIVNAPAVFRKTGEISPERHLQAASALGVTSAQLQEENAGHILADQVIKMMKETQMPNGIGAVGYTEKDLDALASRAYLQQRLISNGPWDLTQAEMKDLFADALQYW